QAEVAANGVNLDAGEAGLLEQVMGAVASVAEEIVRRLVDFPLVRHDEQQTAAGRQRAGHLSEGAARLADVLERDDVEASAEGAGAEGQRGEVGDGVETAVVPGSVAHGKIHTDVTGARKEACVAALAGAGVKHAISVGEAGGESGDG